ncbi:uncharacterized protein G2W53_007227 [Senna tora]|uniref:Uncharacterized protein n=1 Tax=Senna tora TaxID=362788 RepID=A0A834X6C3_9FABA|nr:uncharacterized protein G2W53_007227 [Senna tora]
MEAFNALRWLPCYDAVDGGGAVPNDGEGGLTSSSPDRKSPW